MFKNTYSYKLERSIKTLTCNKTLCNSIKIIKTDENQ